MKTKLFLFLVLLIGLGILGTSPIYAQSQGDTTITNQLNSLSSQLSSMKLGDSHFMMVGLATFGFVNQKTINTLGGVKTSSIYNSLGDADRYELSPMFLWRHGDNTLIEFEPSFDGTGLGVNWAAISYFAAPGLIFRGGYFVLPFGTYSKRLAAGWINKLASDPMGVDPAGTDFGVEVEGGLPLGNMKWSYDLALSNGFQLNPDGTIQSVGISAISNNKTLTGRVSILPFSNSSLEIGASGLTGTLATAPNTKTNYLDPQVQMLGLDLHYIKNLSPFQINIKGQFSLQHVNNQNYISPVDSTQFYTYKNDTYASFGQISIRPSFLEDKTLKNLELAYRYVNFKSPVNSTWGQNYSENDIGLDYWLSWRTVLKFTYESIGSTGTSNALLVGPQGTSQIHRMVLQFSTGF